MMVIFEGIRGEKGFVLREEFENNLVNSFLYFDDRNLRFDSRFRDLEFENKEDVSRFLRSL